MCWDHNHEVLFIIHTCSQTHIHEVCSALVSCLQSLPPPSFSLNMCVAIAEEPEIREYILQLKTEFGKTADRAREEEEAEKSEELGPRTRRFSVRRMRQAEKTNKMKDSIKEEAMLRRESMVKEVCVVCACKRSHLSLSQCTQLRVFCRRMHCRSNIVTTAIS